MVTSRRFPDSLTVHPGYQRVFQKDKLTLGFILPLEAYPDEPAPTMADHAETTRLADNLGFGALWARDVALYDPMFGDVGQIYDPFTYLGFLAANTQKIALGTGSAVITLRHPIHVAKAASSIDQLSNGRLLLGIASGDRPVEYPAFGLEADYESRGERFREAFAEIRTLTEDHFPRASFERFGSFDGRTDLIPKPRFGRLPAFVTGSSRQDLTWIATNSDGWFYYYVPVQRLAPLTSAWHDAVRAAHGDDAFRPFIQGLFFDLDEDPNAPLVPIHSGMRAGRNALIGYLERVCKMGVNHIAFNMKASRRPVSDVLRELGEYVLPHFPSHEQMNAPTTQTELSA
ncbi:LLM class oxidoreductase [Burkholderia sp. Ax-1719]|uniref:LLM class oxidoreductase n=1 Tax=Burkholderia sp. Ax-1719 TaxID=2608334 RepID=UPI001423C2AF|nr:LLM class oxidoreductase [Burkholderia sp. Ax-1719]NIE63077.1 LLM class oxidoreductase [Burkholderia sp. Ax-1719]